MAYRLSETKIGGEDFTEVLGFNQRSYLRPHKHPIIGRLAFDDVSEIMKSGELSMFRGTPEGMDGGKFIQKLEAEFRVYFGVKHAVAMNSATSALHVALVASGVKPDDEVAVSPYTFASSASCVLMVGAKPVFRDIDENTFCIMSERNSIPVHLMGHPADMKVRPIIEDAAQAIGAVYHNQLVGTIGDCGIFSFNQSKPVSSGEGGMLITNNDDIAYVARALRNHAEVSAPHLRIVGYNYRMNEIEAAIVLEQFKKLDEMNDYRIKLCDYMTERLAEIPCITPPVVKPNCKHVYYTYSMKFNEDLAGMSRDKFQKKMQERGIYFGSGYVKPLHLLPIFGGHDGQFPVAERMWKKELMVIDWLRFPAIRKDVDHAIRTAKRILRL